MGNGVHAFGPGTRLNIGKDGVLTIGSGFRASVNNRIHCYKSIVIGEDNLWSFDNVVMDTVISEENCIITTGKKIIRRHVYWSHERPNNFSKQ